MPRFIVTVVLRIDAEEDSAEQARETAQYMDWPELELPFGWNLLGGSNEVISVEAVGDA
jgi:hypothetical protein